MNGWQVSRFDVNTLPPDRLQQAMDWVRRYGVDPADVRPTVTVSVSDVDDPAGEGVMRLHLSRFWLVDGKKVVDHNLDVIATTPLVIDISPADPPPWLRPTTEE